MPPLNHCYEIIKDHVSFEDWESYRSKLPSSRAQIPPEWGLNAAMRHRLIFQIQWEYYNPDHVSELAEKEKVAQFFLARFLSPAFLLRWKTLRNRLEPALKEPWLQSFCQMGTLLDIYKQPEEERIGWLMHFDSERRFGKSKRARVIKAQSLGLVSDLLGVDKTMNWAQIKTQYRKALKAHHPDHNPEKLEKREVHDIVNEFERLEREKEERKKPF